MGGAADEFEPLAEMATRAGFACYGLNLRGQGHDPRRLRRGHYLDVPALCEEIAAFTREAAGRHARIPVFLCGESMGALLVGRTVALRQIEVSGVIFSAPVVDLHKPTPWLVRQAVRLLACVLPAVRFTHSWFVSGKKEVLPVTRDKEYLHRVRSAEYAIPVFTFHFLNALGDLISSSEAMARDITAPCLVLAAGRDVFLRAEQVRAWFDQLASSDKTYRLYAEAYHCLWNDWEREAVLRDIAAWLEAKSAPEPSARGWQNLETKQIQ